MSKEHQQVMALDRQDNESIESRLTEGDVVPPPVATFPDTSEVSSLAVDTREIKSKAYAVE